MSRGTEGAEARVPTARWPTGRGRQVWVLLLLIILAATAMPLAADTDTDVWSAGLGVGKDPVALVVTDKRLLVVSGGPSAKTVTVLKGDLARAADTSTEVASRLLREVVGKVAELTTVVSLSMSPDGRFWPLWERLLYEVSETYYGETEESKRQEFSGEPVAAVSMIKDTTPVVLVATSDSSVFEVNSTTGAIQRLEGFPDEIRSMAAGDVTGDGQAELVVVAAQSVSVYKTAGGQYERWEEWRGGQGGELGFAPCYVTVSDVNGDGAGDLLVANDGSAKVRGQGGLVQTYEDASIHVILSERTGFSAPKEIETAVRPRSLAAGDFNGDGLVDVAVAGETELAVHVGTGDAAFGSKTSILVGDASFPNNDFNLPAARLVAADLNHDHYDELLVVTSRNGKVTLFWGPFGNGTDGFARRTELEGVDEAVDLAVLDGDGDSDEDLIVLDRSTSEVVVFLQRPGNSFLRRPDPKLGPGASFVAFGGQGAATKLALAIASPMLTVRDTIVPNYLQIDTWRRPDNPPDTRTMIANLGYAFYAPDAPEVKCLIAKGGAIAGVPVAAGETSDYSFAVLTGREKAGSLATAAGKGEPFCVSGVFEYIKGKDLPDLVLTFQSGTVSVEQAPWPIGATETLPKATPGTTAFADLNSDGVVDVVSVDPTRRLLRVALGSRTISTNPVTFSLLTHYSLPGTRCVAVTLADLDEDGHQDVALVDADSDCVRILWGKGDGTFGGNMITQPVGTMPTAIAATRISEGGKPILAVANFASGNVSIVGFGIEGGPRNPSVVQTVGVGAGPISISAARSLDWLAGKAADEYFDLVLACYASDEVVILRGGTSFSVHPVAATLPIRNVLGASLDVRDGHGPTSVVTGDFNLDGADDVAVSVGFPEKRLVLAREDLYAPDAKSKLSGLWQDVFMYYSGITIGGGPWPPPPPTRSVVVDVSGGSGPNRGILHVLQRGEAGTLVTRMVCMDEGGAEWQLLREIPMSNFCSALTVEDLNGDGYVELITLDTAANRMTVLWGPIYAQRDALVLPASPGTVAFATGVSPNGAWLAGGTQVSVATSPTADLTTWRALTINLAGGHPRAALAIPARGRLGLPDLLVLSYRPDIGADEIRVFSGSGLLQGILTAERVWQMPYRVEKFTAGHFDDDNGPDAVVAYVEQDTGEVWLASGDRQVLKGVGPGFAGFGVGDLTGDGLTDLVVVCATALSGRVRILAGIGDGSFVPVLPELRLDSPPADPLIMIDDVDRDGRPDAIVCDQDKGLFAVFRQGSGGGREQELAGLRFLELRSLVRCAGMWGDRGSLARSTTSGGTKEMLASNEQGDVRASAEGGAEVIRE